MERVNISEARARLEELIDRAAAGETLIIAREGAPSVRLAPEPASAAAPRFDLDALAAQRAKLPMDPRPREEIEAALRTLDRY